MTDIVERLREQPTMSVFANIGDLVGRLNHEREEAAEEIERLRRALREITELNLNDPAALSIFLARTALEGKE